MVAKLLSGVTGLIFILISKISYLGIILLMGIESCNIPLPSELIMPYAGFLVHKGVLNIHFVAFAGAIGCVVGSLISYYLGYLGGRPFLEKYGKFLLLSKEDLETGDKLFAKYGDKIAFFSRLIPIVRTFISFPAGVLKTNLKKFLAYTFLGSLLWSYILAYVGIKIGDNQKILSKYFHQFDLIIGIVLIVGITYYIYRHVQKLRK